MIGSIVLSRLEKNDESRGSEDHQYEHIMIPHSDGIVDGSELGAPRALLNRMRKVAESNGHSRIDAERMARIKQRKKAGKNPEAHPVPNDGSNRAPKLLGGVFSQLSKVYGWDSGISAGLVLDCWERAVPKAIGQACKAESMDGRSLVVRCENASWVAQVKLHEKQLVELLCKELGQGAVEAILPVNASNARRSTRR